MKQPEKDHLERHSFLLMAWQQVGNLSNTAFQVLLANILLKTEFGIVAALLNVVVIFSVPMEAVRTAVAHFTARLVQDGRRGDVRVLMKQWYVYLAFPAVPVLLAGLLFAEPLSAYFHIETRGPVMLTAVILAASFYKFPFIGALQGLQAFWRLPITSHTWSVVRLLAAGLLVIWVSPVAMSALGGQMVAVVVTLAVGAYFLYGLLQGEVAQQRRVAGVRRYVFRSFFILVGFSILMNADIIMVRHYFPDQAGFYAKASTIARSVIFFPQPIAAAMFPKVASAGAVSTLNWRTLVKALVYTAVCIVAIVGVISLVPGVMLKLFGESAPTAEELKLVRGVLWAMAPLAMVFLLMNFELAQHRFGATWPLLLCGLGFLVAVFYRHERVEEVVWALGIACGAAAALLVAGLPWRGVRAARASA